jgi:fatty-acyl-CoA synthase
MLRPLPTSSGLTQRPGDFATLSEALDFAATGETGLNFYSVRGELTAALSYRALREDALAMAGRLRGLGLQTGERVAIIAETHPDFVRVFCACLYAGLVAVPLPLPFAFGGRETYVAHIERLASEAKAVALFTPEAITGWFDDFAAARPLRFCGTVADLQASETPSADLPVINAEHTAYLQFSSGSTRFPMGAVIRQSALMANAAAILTHGLEIRPDDRAVSWLPLYHDMGLVGFLLAPMAGQVTVDLFATQDFARRPNIWLSVISNNRGTISYSPSFGYDLCTRRERSINKSELDLSSWRIAGIGGDMIRPAALSKFSEVFGACGFQAKAFLPSYGMAESTLAISFAPIDRGIETDVFDLDLMEQTGLARAPMSASARTRTVVLCGVALPGHDIEIRSPAGALLPDREVGHIFVRGPSVMQGYDGLEGETAAILSPDGWLATGDLGYRLGESLVVTGRTKDLIIINGRNIWPQDLEWSVEHVIPEIRTGDVAAFSVEEDGKEVLILAVEARGLDDAEAGAKLIASVSDAVRTNHGLDSRIVLVRPGSLPYTSSGKLSRTIARQHYLTATSPAIADAA